MPSSLVEKFDYCCWSDLPSGFGYVTCAVVITGIDQNRCVALVHKAWRPERVAFLDGADNFESSKTSIITDGLDMMGNCDSSGVWQAWQIWF